MSRIDDVLAFYSHLKKFKPEGIDIQLFSNEPNEGYIEMFTQSENEVTINPEHEILYGIDPDKLYEQCLKFIQRRRLDEFNNIKTNEQFVDAELRFLDSQTDYIKEYYEVVISCFKRILDSYPIESKNIAQPLYIRDRIKSLFSLRMGSHEVDPSIHKVIDSIISNGAKVSLVEIDTNKISDLSKIIVQYFDNEKETSPEVDDFGIKKNLITSAEDYLSKMNSFGNIPEDHKLISDLKNWIAFLKYNVEIDEKRPDHISINTHNDYDWSEGIGLVDSFKNKGVTINPTHNSKLLIQVREVLYQGALVTFLKDRTNSRLDTDDDDIRKFRIIWLYDELETIKKWNSPFYPNGEKKILPQSALERVELDKYKEYLKSEMQKVEAQRTESNISKEQPIEKTESATLNKIKEAFTSIDNKKGWKYAFDSESDFLALSEAIFDHFEGREPVLPKTIKLKKRTKTNIAKALGNIHSQLSKEPIFKHDQTFFTIIQCIEDFQNETDLAKTLKR